MKFIPILIKITSYLSELITLNHLSEINNLVEQKYLFKANSNWYKKGDVTNSLNFSLRKHYNGYTQLFKQITKLSLNFSFGLKLPTPVADVGHQCHVAHLQCDAIAMLG